MRIIKPYFEILSNIDSMSILKFIERIGRVCYKSEENITNFSCKNFVNKIIYNEHESVLEHEKITVLIICNRGVSHELVRHRIASYSQESTRYCNYSKDKFNNTLTFILPPWIRNEKLLDTWEIEWSGLMGFLKKEPTMDELTKCWFWNMAIAERNYLQLIQQNWSPQKARDVLPNALKTEIVITANLREWRHILKLRTNKKAHPQMREIMLYILQSFQRDIPIIFDDIKIDENDFNEIKQ